MSIRLMMNGRSLRLEHVNTQWQLGRKGMFAKRHQHPVFHIMYVTGGLGAFGVNDEESIASTGLLYMINPNEWHSFSGNEADPLNNLECTFMVLDESDTPAVVNFFDWVEDKRGIKLPDALRRGPIKVPAILRPFLLEGFQRILEPGNRYVTSEHLALMVIDLLLRTEETISRIGRMDLTTGTNIAEKAVDDLKNYMKAHMMDQIKLTDLSQLVHWTPNYLCRVFKKHTNETPMSFLQQIRMIEAEKLILYTDLPIYTIAEMLGFEDASYFARVFRLHHGRAPTEYRIK